MKIRTKLLGFALPALLLACVGSGLWYLRTDSFQEWARSILISKIEKATDLRCHLEHFTLDVYRGRFVVKGLVLLPKTPAQEALSLRVSEIGARISISSIWRLRLHLAELTVSQPQIELRSGNEASSWNPEDVLKALKISLRLEASNVTVTDGWIKLNDRKSPFHLRMDDLDCEIRYAKKIPSYKIHISYKRSLIHWEKRDILHDLDLLADISLQGIDFERFRLRRGSSLFVGSGSYKNWNAPVLFLNMAGVLEAGDLALASPSLFEGKGNINVSVSLRADREGIHAKGRFRSVHGKYRKMAYGMLAGNFEIERDILFLRGITGRIADGTITVQAEIQLRESNKAPNRVTIHTKSVPIVDAGRLLNLPLMNFENPADIAAVLVWHGGKPLRADCDAYVHGMTRTDAKAYRQLLLDGNIRFTYLEPGDVSVAFANLRSPYSAVQVSGGQSAPFHVQLSTTHIAEPMHIIAGFSPPVADLLRRYPDLAEMAGRYDFDGDVRIRSSSDVEYQGSFGIQNGHWRSYVVDGLSAQAKFRSSRLKLESMSLRSGQQKAHGELDLEIGDNDQLSEFGFRGNLHQVSLASLKDFGVDTSQIGGVLSGTGSLALKNGYWEGNGSVVIEEGTYRGESFDSIRAQLQLQNQHLHLTRAEARRGRIQLTAEGDFDLKAKQMNIPVHLRGLSLDEIPVVKEKRIPVHGTVNASGVLKGTSGNPEFSGEFELSALQYDRWNLGGGSGRIEMKDGSLRGAARIRSELGRLNAQAVVSTRSGYPGNIRMEFADLNVQKIMQTKAPAYLGGLSTDLNGKADIKGNFADFSTVELRGEVDGAHFKIQDYELHNAGSIQFAMTNRNFRVENAQFVGDGTSLALTGSFPLDDSPQLDLALNGKMNLHLLEGIEKKAKVDGGAILNIRATGSRKNPQIIGRASFQDARLDSEGLPSKLSSMQGDVVFSRNIVRLENVRGLMASGTIRVSGAIEHENAVFRSINMGISIHNARLQYPKDFRSLVDAELTLNGTRDAQILSGDINVLRMEYVRSFNLLEQLASRSSVSTGPLTTEPYLLGLRLNLEIHSDNGLYIDNELARLRGSMRLTLRGTPAYPSLTGRVEASEGTIFFRGSRFAITRGAANFIDRNRINPVLEVRAEADVKTYRLILDAMGDLEHLNLNITSDPVMSTVDILSLLTTGKSDSSTATSQRESEIAGVSAASVLSENLTGVIGKRVQRIFGLESFRVDPFLAGAENDPTARITISERISKDMVVTFSRNLTTNREQIVVIEYDVTRDLSMVATRDENGKFGLDFRFRKRWR